VGILSKLEERSTASRPRQWLFEALGVHKTASGAVVNPETAMTYSAVYAAVNILSSAIASLPLHLYRKVPVGKEKADKHPLYAVLHDTPNNMMTSFTFRQTSMVHVLLHGNFYAYIERDGNGQVKSLWPLVPEAIQVVLVGVNGREKRYVYQQQNGKEHTFFPEEIFHVHGLGTNGIQGQSVIRHARETVGLGLSAEEFGGKFFSNGATLSGVLEHEGVLGTDGVNNLRDSFSGVHQGSGNSHKVAILEEGIKYKQIGIAPEDAQFLETRKFQVQEIARWFNIPPHKLAEMTDATFSNIEHQQLSYVQDSLRPWLVNWEQTIHKDLLGKDQRKMLFAKFNVNGLLRGDIKARYESYAIGKQNGFLNTDDIRELEDMNKSPNGERFYESMNMIPADKIDEKLEADTQAPEGERSLNEVETRTNQDSAVEMRSRVSQSYRKVIVEAFRRVIKREEADIMRKVKKGVDPDILRLFVSDFYREHAGFIVRNLVSILTALGETIYGAVMMELGRNNNITPEAERFIDDYLTRLAERHSGDSFNRIRKIIDEAEDLETALQAEFDSWREERPEDMAQQEVVRFGNALAKTTYIAAGVKTIRWTAPGQDCQFCAALDGTEIGSQGFFVEKKSAIQGKDGGTFNSSIAIGHPPLHKGCDCQIVKG
jgi:HK97 family phage portal protein